VLCKIFAVLFVVPFKRHDFESHNIMIVCTCVHTKAKNVRSHSPVHFQLLSPYALMFIHPWSAHFRRTN
jgi:hypothetical protein